MKKYGPYILWIFVLLDRKISYKCMKKLTPFMEKKVCSAWALNPPFNCLNMRLSPLGYWACNWSCLFFYSYGYASCEKVEKIQTEVPIFRFVQWWIITPMYCNIWGKVQNFYTILQFKIRTEIYFYTVLKYYTFSYFSTTFCWNFPEALFSWWSTAFFSPST